MKRIIGVIFLSLVLTCSWGQSSKHPSGDLPTSEKRANAVYLDLGGEGVLGSVSYDRLISFNEKNGIAVGVSVGFLADFILKANYLYGESNHFLELGVGYSMPEQLIIPRLGYRYTGDKGFVFRAGGMYLFSTQPDSFGDFPTAGLSFGYAF